MLNHYRPQHFFCELMGREGSVPAHALSFAERLKQMDGALLAARNQLAQQDLFRQGITFTLYSGNESFDRVLPFDVIPRIISPADWAMLERGVIQRVTALNLFLDDIYHGQKILKDGIIPQSLVLGNRYFRPEMAGFKAPGGVYVHICGVDLIRDEQGVFRVLEDNARSPSGVSYVVQNRILMLRLFPDLFTGERIAPVIEYGQKLRKALAEVAPASSGADPSIVLLSPGSYNSAYYEHVFLAQEMGVTLVEGTDLLVEDDKVFMKTTQGKKRVDVIYRRIDDDFLDPAMFNPTSMLGVRGLMSAYLKGNVTIANAPGTGVADDKAVYAYMPRIIKYYLGEDAIIANVQTNICAEKEALQYTLDNLEKLVVKPVGESGGYGLMIGPNATAAERETCRQQLIADPANYISQPVISLSVCPTLIGDALEARHVDLRPFVVTGKSSWVLPGGLTRVALKKGSLVVNSSQGGGSKDTWVYE